MLLNCRSKVLFVAFELPGFPPRALLTALLGVAATAAASTFGGSVPLVALSVLGRSRVARSRIVGAAAGVRTGENSPVSSRDVWDVELPLLSALLIRDDDPSTGVGSGRFGNGVEGSLRFLVLNSCREISTCLKGLFHNVRI